MVCTAVVHSSVLVFPQQEKETLRHIPLCQCWHQWSPLASPQGQPRGGMLRLGMLRLATARLPGLGSMFKWQHTCMPADVIIGSNLGFRRTFRRTRAFTQQHVSTQAQTHARLHCSPPCPGRGPGRATRGVCSSVSASSSVSTFVSSAAAVTGLLAAPPALYVGTLLLGAW